MNQCAIMGSHGNVTVVTARTLDEVLANPRPGDKYRPRFSARIVTVPDYPPPPDANYQETRDE